MGSRALLAAAFHRCLSGRGFWRAAGVTLGLLMAGALGFVLVGFPIAFSASAFGDDGWISAFLSFQLAFVLAALGVAAMALLGRPWTWWAPPFVVWAAVIQPMVSRWMWGSLLHGAGWLEAGDGSWLTQLGLPGAIDFAGSGVLYLAVGVALASTLLSLPRPDTPDNGPRRRWQAGLVVFGGMLFLAMAPLLSAGVEVPSRPVASQGAVAFIAVNTNLAVFGAVLAAVTTAALLRVRPSLHLAYGFIVGEAAIAGPVANIMPWAALVTGVTAGTLLAAVTRLTAGKGDLDDPGWGVARACLVGGSLGLTGAALFNIGGLDLRQLATQLIACAAISLWTAATMVPLALLARRYLPALPRTAEANPVEVFE